MNPIDMNPMMNMPDGFGQGSQGTNLLSILINAAFGFVAGLMLFIGPKEVIAYGSKLAGELIKLTGYGQQMAAFGFATTAAPYIVLAPIVGLVVRQLASVRSLKSFAFFALAAAVGFGAAYFGQDYITTTFSIFPTTASTSILAVSITKSNFSSVKSVMP